MSHPMHYYIGEGPEAERLIAEAVEKQERTNEARKAVMKEYNADGLLSSRWGSGVAGLCFKEKQSLPYLKGEVCLADGYGYYPKLNCKAGKELAEKLSAPGMTFSFGDYLVNKLGVDRMIVGRHHGSHTGSALYRTVAGCVGGKLLVKIPGGSEKCGGDKMPEIPAWLREVKESEWLAAQGK